MIDVPTKPPKCRVMGLVGYLTGFDDWAMIILASG